MDVFIEKDGKKFHVLSAKNTGLVTHMIELKDAEFEDIAVEEKKLEELLPEIEAEEIL
jgi:hypothetical protein